MGMLLKDNLLDAVYNTVEVRISVASLGHLCPRIHPGVDCFLGLLTLH